jgi:hypothetical protein
VKIRGHPVVLDRVTMTATVEREWELKLVCVAELLFRYLG